MEVADGPRVNAVYDSFVSFLPHPFYWVKFGEEPAVVQVSLKNARGGEIAKIAGVVDRLLQKLILFFSFNTYKNENIAKGHQSKDLCVGTQCTQEVTASYTYI